MAANFVFSQAMQNLFKQTNNVLLWGNKMHEGAGQKHSVDVNSSGRAGDVCSAAAAEAAGAVEMAAVEAYEAETTASNSSTCATPCKRASSDIAFKRSWPALDEALDDQADHVNFALCERPAKLNRSREKHEAFGGHYEL